MGGKQEARFMELDQISGGEMERDDKNRRGVPQGAEMRDLVNGRISVVHLNGLLLPSNNNIETKE